jgi:carbonic anhydrase
LIDNWLRHVQDVAKKHGALLSHDDPEERLRRLCELNVIEQALNAAQTTVVQQAWSRGQVLSVHAWIYAISDGLLRDLHMSISGAAELASAYNEALAARAGLPRVRENDPT